MLLSLRQYKCQLSRKLLSPNGNKDYFNYVQVVAT
jgi:hypothetical protein